MNDFCRRINKESANASLDAGFCAAAAAAKEVPFTDFFSVDDSLAGGRICIPRVSTMVTKNSRHRRHEWRSDTPLAENTGHAVVVATAAETEVTAVEGNNQNQIATGNKADELIAENNLPATDKVKKEIKQLPRQPRSPARHSPCVTKPVVSKSAGYANTVRAASLERKTVDAGIDVVTGSVALPEVLAEHREQQQQIVIPEVTFSRHGRLMGSTNE